MENRDEIPVGVTGVHCEKAIQSAVARLGGGARVDLASGTHEVTGLEDAAGIRVAVEAEGFPAVVRESR